MPIGLDSRRIVGLDDVNGFEPLRQLNANFSLSPERIVCSTDLKFSACSVPKEVDVSHSAISEQRWFVGIPTDRWTRRQLLTKASNVGVSPSGSKGLKFDGNFAPSRPILAVPFVPLNARLRCECLLTKRRATTLRGGASNLGENVLSSHSVGLPNF